jgi:hypothetical protein
MLRSNGMKRGVNHLLCLFLFVLITVGATAQVTATASVTATIVVPLGISKQIDLDFGNVGAGVTPGTVVLSPAGSRQKSGGVSLPNLAGTVSAASFNITGAPNFAYSITLPGQPLTISNGSENMTVSGFTSDPPVTGVLGGSGLQELTVGATLVVGALQQMGDYTSPQQFFVTVNYN